MRSRAATFDRGGEATISVHAIDLTDDDAVRAVADDVASIHPHIRGLITCAGSSMLGNIDQTAGGSAGGTSLATGVAGEQTSSGMGGGMGGGGGPGGDQRP